jgi:phage recombination protein Bet
MSKNLAVIDTQSTEIAHPAAANMPAGAHQRGITPESWHVMSTVLFKGASPEMICTLVDYCKARKLDPLKRPFHIVQVYDMDSRGYVESIWPGIGELRTTAMRTGNYAGKSEIEFGPDKTRKWGDVELTFPEWAQCKVFRIVGGHRVEFAGSKVYWLEAYASKKGGVPNAMWAKRPRGQLAKCAEAEALRSAFPEELGHEVTADEMDGQRIGFDRAKDVTPQRDLAAELAEQIEARPEHEADTGELFESEPEPPAETVDYVSTTGEVEKIPLDKALHKLRVAHKSPKLDNDGWFNLYKANEAWLNVKVPDDAKALSVRGGES